MYFKTGYGTEALRTNGPLVGTYPMDRDLIHAAFGIADETFEILRAIELYVGTNSEPARLELVEEIGDAFWFSALLSHARPIDAPLEQFYPLVECCVEKEAHKYGLVEAGRELAVAANHLVGPAKKLYAYGKAWDPGQAEAALQYYLLMLTVLCHHAGVAPRAAQEANIAKLAARFPGAFTNDSAITRDAAAERTALNDALTETEGNGRG